MICIVRHGQTASNQRRRLQGRSDTPLNEHGRRQAREVSEKLRASGILFDRVYSSPLIRAVQTAEIIAPEKEPIPDDRLIEMEYGPYEGADLNDLPPEVLTFFKDFVHNPAPDGMEPLADVVARTGAFLESLRALSGNVLISTHAIAMKGMLEYLTPDSRGAYWSKYIGNCAVYALSNDDGIFGIPKALLL